MDTLSRGFGKIASQSFSACEGYVETRGECFFNALRAIAESRGDRPLNWGSIRSDGFVRHLHQRRLRRLCRGARAEEIPATGSWR